MDDENDTHFNNHVFNDLESNHRMCSFGEWKLCKENFAKDITIEKLELQLEENCSEEVVILREKILILEKQVEKLKEKLYTNKNELSEYYEQIEQIEQISGGGTKSKSKGTNSTDSGGSRLSRRRKITKFGRE